MGIAAAVAAGLVGVALGAWLARRNEKQATTERLLVEAVNDLVDGVAGVAQSVPHAQAKFVSTDRLPLRGCFAITREDATTITPEGRLQLIAAIQEARKELGHQRGESPPASVRTAPWEAAASLGHL